MIKVSEFRKRKVVDASQPDGPLSVVSGHYYILLSSFGENLKLAQGKSGRSQGISD